MSARDLTIKINIVKRLQKDLVSYLKEAETQRARIQKLRDANADEADIRKQTEVLEETTNMLPDVQNRLNAAAHGLQQAMQSPAFQDLPELKEAESVLASLQQD